MTHVERAFQAANKAGYKWDDTGVLYCKEKNGSFLCREGDYHPKLISVEQMLWDWNFWKAYGKSRRWTLDETRHYWTLLVEHRRRGHDFESYFEWMGRGI